MAKITEFGCDLEGKKFKEELAEEVRHKYDIPTNYPQPVIRNPLSGARYVVRHRLVYEAYNMSVEEVYFWLMDHLRTEDNFPYLDKLTDIFAASEQSAFFGVSQQRLGLQQDRVSQYLATIGKMVKELFQLVREIRILDERLYLYKRSYEKDQASEISLKGYWIDMVEGGAKNPASVYGMARELQFSTLPDLFFASPPHIEAEEVDSYVDSLEFNEKVKEVLKRKLKTYLVWKKHTHAELVNRRTFTLKYLRQHYNVIKMYLQWIKPYLKNIRRLHMDQTKVDTVDLINAFEGSMIEIEILARKKVDNAWCVLLMHFDYRTRPEMKYQQEGYQRGPVHVGRVQVTGRGYAWTDKQIEEYKKFREKDDFELIMDIDESVKAAYTALGKELEEYLTRAEEEKLPEFERHEYKPEELKRYKEKAKGPKRPSVFDPFISVFKGIKEIGGGFTGTKGPGEKVKKISGREKFKIEQSLKKAEEEAEKALWLYIRRFKASRGMFYP